MSLRLPYAIDFLRNSIRLLKLPFSSSLQSNFSTMCLHMLSKFDCKSAQKWLIFPTKAGYAGSLIKISLFFIWASALFGADNFSVSLDTECPLEPLYLSPLLASKGDFDTKYRNGLSEVLDFDLSHNGMTGIVTSEKSALYTLSWCLQGKKLDVTLTWVKTKKAKKLETLTLTGTLSTDRKTIHKVADWVVKSLYKMEGVASTTILYTIRQKNNDATFKSEYLSEVWECDWDGKNAHQITNEGRYMVTPCYCPAPKGYRPGAILTVSYKLGQPKITLFSLKDKSSERLTSLRGNQFMPSVSKNGKKIAFISDAMGNPDLFIIEPELSDKPRQIFASPKGTQGSPTFSPDGERIAFVSNKDGSPRIYTMDVPGPLVKLREMKPRLISRSCRENTSPCWSPDGRFIAYSAMTSKTRQIWVYDVENDREEQITFDSGHKENPFWAPDSFHLVFNSDQGTGKAELYILNLNQREPVSITTGGEDKRFPAWQP